MIFKLCARYVYQHTLVDVMLINILCQCAFVIVGYNSACVTLKLCVAITFIQIKHDIIDTVEPVYNKHLLTVFHWTDI